MSGTRRTAILDALKTTHWNRRQAAVLLHVDYKALLYKMKGLSIKKEKPGVTPLHPEIASVAMAAGPMNTPIEIHAVARAAAGSRASSTNGAVFEGVAARARGAHHDLERPVG